MAQRVRVLDQAKANRLLPTIADAIRTVGPWPGAAVLGAVPDSYPSH